MTTNKPNYLPVQLFLILGLVTPLVCAGYFGYRSRALSAKQEMIKADHPEINNIAYGLLSVDHWRSHFLN